MGFREVSVNEIREVLCGGEDGVGLRVIAERAGVNRKTARGYGWAGQAAGLERTAGLAAATKEVGGTCRTIGQPGRKRYSARSLEHTSSLQSGVGRRP